MKCTGHNPVGQRMRTPKEREAFYQMHVSGTYSEDQWDCEEKLQAIHETGCEACARFAKRLKEKQNEAYWEAVKRVHGQTYRK